MMPTSSKGGEAMIEKIVEQCKQLRLKTVMQNLEQVLEQANAQNWPYSKTIEHLLDMELEQRRQSRIALRFKQSTCLKNQPWISLTLIITVHARDRKLRF
jgi:hypothetical protein